jgi:hypothetical protein
MTTGTNGSWFTSLPSCETTVPCGNAPHTIRWEAGALRLLEHPDPEGEQVLAALGGERARCIEVSEAWARHVSDLSVLAIGPRGPDDQITVGWDDVAAATRTGLGPRPAPAAGQAGARAAQQPARTQVGRPGAALIRSSARQRQLLEAAAAAQRRRDDLLTLLALGYEFQVRLAAQVAVAYSAPGAEPGPPTVQETRVQKARTQKADVQKADVQKADVQKADVQKAEPALVAAIAGRLAPVAERWLGIDPDQVLVRLHHGPGWGSAEMSGREAERRLRVALPVGWLAAVWACGLTLTGRHLVVAVDQPGWPDARVLGLRAPGAEPELLDVHADADGTWNVRH